MGDFAPLIQQVTVHKHRFWLRDDESLCYSLEPELGRDIAVNSRMIKPVTQDTKYIVSVGCIRVTRHTHATVDLPLNLPKRGTQPIRVSADWLMAVTPLINEALRLYEKDPFDSFTLAFGLDGSIIKLPPDRKSISPPRGEEP